MRFSVFAGVAVAVAGIIALFTLDSRTIGIILVVAGVITVLAALFRRHSRPGDYGRSGTTGIG